MNFTKLATDLGLDESEYRELVDLFMTTSAAEFDKLKAALTAGDADTVMRSAHTLKGAAGNLGLTDVSETAAQIEKSADNGQLNGLGQPVDTLQTQLDAIATFVGK